jgi:hypothetical protein
MPRKAMPIAWSAGTAERREGTIRIRPDGDESCTITARLDNGAMFWVT